MTASLGRDVDGNEVVVVIDDYGNDFRFPVDALKAPEFTGKVSTTWANGGMPEDEEEAKRLVAEAKQEADTYIVEHGLI